LANSLPLKYASPQSSKVIDLAFSSDDKRLCVSSDQTVVYYENSDKSEVGNALVSLLETTTGMIKNIIAFKSDYVTSISTMTNYCLSGLNTGAIKVNQIDNGKEISIAPFHDYDITDMSVSLDNKWLVTSSTDASIKIWKIEGTKFTPTNLFQYNNEVTNVKSTFNNKIIIASVKGMGLILIKDLKKENQIIINKKIEISDIDISEKDSIVFVSYNSNQTYCNVYSYVNNNKLWDFKEVGSKIIKLSYADKYKVIFCALENGNIIILNAKTGKKLCTILLFRNNEWLIYTPDNYFEASSGVLPNINMINKLSFINHEEIEKFNQKEILSKILLQ
jgi:WD40 repeat protein